MASSLNELMSRAEEGWWDHLTWAPHCQVLEKPNVYCVMGLFNTVRSVSAQLSGVSAQVYSEPSCSSSAGFNPDIGGQDGLHAVLVSRAVQEITAVRCCSRACVSAGHVPAVLLHHPAHNHLVLAVSEDLHGAKVIPNPVQSHDVFLKILWKKFWSKSGLNSLKLQEGFGCLSPGVVEPGCPSAFLAREGSWLSLFCALLCRNVPQWL